MATTNEFQLAAAKAMSEAQLQASVLALIKAHRYLVYHTHDSRRSQPGFPDLVILNTRTNRVMYRELKSHTGKPTSDQQTWLAQLARLGADVDLWRPIDLLSGTISRQLGGHQ